MLEKLLLAGTITFCLNLFLQISVPESNHADTSLLEVPGVESTQLVQLTEFK
ncbi:hypothetical protein [Calothrix sp. 336/3]|uniref:hypothetical protein n=1 Tax=Calothrix sp. 336/3 TaxID=1337936 RepID=UPI00143BC792|nr:hypothetical protein [Calothrix sp. 336/3]